MYLGYGPIGKEFKVLCMTSSRYERLNTHQVLTLESGKKRVRRIIEYKFHFMKDDRIRHETCINGVLYFGGKVRGLATIVCFDVRAREVQLY
ncbi:hypothetical protein Bca4012_087666 [Brassica carinata]|uniref:F-box associated beta-propeller type 3 domain-containing protein n=1 Tax=Brassica carinata TaxID=52824 RepID=A0A8X7PE49_BRACI|nr:hypothetical protein Bca52824_088631 [Brassica carinata]